MTDPREVADRYVALARADGKDALADLFADESVFHAPDGVSYYGREEIAAFYRRHLANIVPNFHIHRAAVEAHDCWIELAIGPVGEPTLVASVHFTVDADGLITRLASFPRPLPGSSTP